jgi:hypothetical protein
MPLASMNDPDRWLDLAKEARALAEHIADPKAKRTMLAVADDYERLAKNEQRAAQGHNQNSAETLDRCGHSLRLP